MPRVATKPRCSKPMARGGECCRPQGHNPPCYTGQPHKKKGGGDSKNLVATIKQDITRASRGLEELKNENKELNDMLNQAYNHNDLDRITELLTKITKSARELLTIEPKPAEGTPIYTGEMKMYITQYRDDDSVLLTSDAQPIILNQFHNPAIDGAENQSQIFFERWDSSGFRVTHGWVDSVSRKVVQIG